eukprot:scaffold34335_cov18-Tisochrysis_lutea.AAC.2
MMKALFYVSCAAVLMVPAALEACGDPPGRLCICGAVTNRWKVGRSACAPSSVGWGVQALTRPAIIHSLGACAASAVEGVWGGANKLASANDPGAWKTVVGALTQGLRHLGFSHFAPKELMILENELEVRASV